MQLDGLGEGCGVGTHGRTNRLAEIDPALDVAGPALSIGLRTKCARGVLPLAADLGAPRAGL